MNKLAIALATFVSLAVFGCSQQNSPVEPAQTQSYPQNIIEAAAAQGIELLALPEMPAVNVKNAGTSARGTVTRMCYTDSSSKLKIQYNYNTASGRNVWMSSELVVPVGALDTSRSLTMMVDDELIMTEVSLTFGPHGTKFRTPALLNVDAKGLDLSSWPRNAVPELYYYNPVTKSLEPMQTEKLVINTRSGQLTCVNGKLPHFSQYAFGRRR